MFQELVNKLLWSWEKADDEQILAWANGAAWTELQALAQCEAAQPRVQANADYCTCKTTFSHSEYTCIQCGKPYPPRH